MTLEVTNFLREEMRQRAGGEEGEEVGEITVTVVPVAYGWASHREGGIEDLLSFERLALTTYD
jgi:hypothetical protein